MHRSLMHQWLLGAAVILAGGASHVAMASGTTAMPAGVLESYGKLPLSFEVNEGQVDKAVKFLSRGRGYTLFLTPAEAVLSLSGSRHQTAVVRMRVAGGNRAPRVVGMDPQATRSNYLLGNDSSRWRTGVSHYARVRYEDVYPGVDLIYRGNQRQLEYDFVVAPGADPRRIRLAFPGVESMTIGAQGELVLHTAQGDLVQPPPVAYQEVGRERRRVEGGYVLLAVPGEKGVPGHAGFVVGHYDRDQPLIIDPVLMYSTFLGGSGGDGGLGLEGAGIAVDGAGNAYVTGHTGSTTFPGVDGNSIQPANGGGNSDVFVTKLNAAGTAIVYSTFLGDSGTDRGFAIAVDGAGNAYVTGDTTSSSFPGVGAGSIQPAYGGGGDTFVTKLNATGTAILYSTFLGGSGSDQGSGIAVDGAGNAFVTGSTDSLSFPGIGAGSFQSTYGGGEDDAFVTKLDPTGTAIVYSTFVGGSGREYGYSIAIDGAGNAYITGETFSSDFPGVSPSSIQPANAGGPGNDAYAIKLNATGTASLYSTYLGGSEGERALSIAVDSAGSAYIVGYTNSTDFIGVDSHSIQPTHGGGIYDAFVTKINPGGTAIVYSTYLGGSAEDVCVDIAVDGAGNAYLTGFTASTNFPGVSANSIQPAYGGGVHDAFVTKLNPTGTAIVYSTFLGGSDFDEGTSIAVDSAGNAYVTGTTGSTNFAGVGAGSIQPAFGGGEGDAFVTKIGSPAPIVPIPTLGPWGFGILALFLAAFGLLAMRRRFGKIALVW